MSSFRGLPTVTHIHRFWILQGMTLLQRQELGIVGTVNDTGNSKNGMSDRDSTPQLAVVFNIINHEGGVVKVTDDVLFAKGGLGGKLCVMCEKSSHLDYDYMNIYLCLYDNSHLTILTHLDRIENL